ncbi:Uncharacterised protein [Mycobacteroides abscessus subsp. abscessus]|nr:Uncharacterised protein [Mycobacteroides abscessus subsp. abscessus]SKU41760.1 Uncharacterised protein [Mycobacteroides abscessus subsp. abscessus]SKV30105.1 Uncharacterised protein [Mycobacteroides abscessus subsp. abscessus]
MSLATFTVPTLARNSSPTLSTQRFTKSLESCSIRATPSGL